MASWEEPPLPRSFDSVFYGAAGGAVALPSDDEFNRVSFLSHFNGANNGVNNAFNDGSTNNYTVTAAGNVTQGSFGPFCRPDGEWGVSFDGNGDKLTLAASSDFAAGTGDFTFETFLFKTETTSSSQYDGIFYSATTQRIKFQQSDSIIYIQTSARDVAIVNNDQGTFIGVWRHLAVCRSSNTLRTYVDGTLATTITLNSDETFGTSSPSVIIGQNAQYFGGVMSNFRYVVGSALHTGSSLTVPTAPLTAVTNTKLLTCQSNRFVDNSASAHTVTPSGNAAVTAFGPFLTSSVYDAAVNGASAFFDGTGDYLSMDGPGTLGASANWCMECFFYCNDIDPGIVRIMSVNEATDADAFTLMRIRNSKYEFYSGGGSSYAYSNQIGTANYNEWAHIALTKSGTTVRGFVNGIKLWEATHNATNVIAKLITGWGYGSEYFPGYISDARFVNGSSVYTGNFTPPTAPLTAITNTSQLLNMADGQAIDSAAQNNLTLDDNTKISNGQAKFGNTSLLFDGTNDYATTIFKTSFGAGNFTIEYFFRVGSVSTNQNLFQFGGSFLPDDDGGPGLGIRTSRWRLYTGANTATHHGSAGPSNDTWYHIAVVRIGTTTKLYVDGVETISVSDSYDYSPRKYLLLGGGFDGSYDMNGYMDEFRVSYFARYTSNNFTVPSEPFADKGQ